MAYHAGMTFVHGREVPIYAPSGMERTLEEVAASRGLVILGANDPVTPSTVEAVILDIGTGRHWLAVRKAEEHGT